MMGGSNTSQSTTEMPEWQQQFVQEAMGEAQNLFQGEGPQFTPFGQVAGFTEAEELGQRQVLRAAELGGPQVVNPAQEAWRFGLSDVLRPESNPYLLSYIEAAIRPVDESLTETLLPGIRSSAIGSGNLGTSRQGIAEGIALGKATQTKGDIAARIASDAYNRGLGTYETALGLAPQMFDLGLAPGQTTAAVGAQQRAMSQAQIDAQRERFDYEQNLPYQQLQEYLASVTGNFGGTSESLSPNFFSQLFGS